MKINYNTKIKALKKEKNELREKMQTKVANVEAPFLKQINDLDRRIWQLISDKKTERVQNKLK